MYKDSPDKNHYVYRITNKVNGMHYYGVRSCRCQPKNDLGIVYFSSSKRLKRDIEEFGKDAFRYKIVRQFTDRKSAVEHECYLHECLDVSRNPKFYNRMKQKTTGFDTSGVKMSEEARAKMIGRRKGIKMGPWSEERRRKYSERKRSLHLKHTPEHCAKISSALKGKPKSEEHNKKVSMALLGIERRKWTQEERDRMSLRISGSGHYNWGKKLSPELREKMSVSHLGKKLPEEQRRKISESNMGKKMSDEAKAKLSEWRTEFYRRKREEAAILKSINRGLGVTDLVQKNYVIDDSGAVGQINYMVAGA